MVVLNAAASAEETRRINHAIHMVNDGFLLYGMKHVLEFKKMMEEKYIVSDCLLGQPQVENAVISTIQPFNIISPSELTYF